MPIDKFIPIPTGNTYNLSGYCFKIYSIDGFCFDKSIDISSANGVYCFTAEINKEIVGNEQKVFKKLHSLIYLGKSEDNDGINGRLISSHEHFNDIKTLNPTSLGIYECVDGEGPKQIESAILAEYNFIINKAENTDSNGRMITVTED